MGRASPPHPRTNPSPVVLRLEKTPEPDTVSPRERAVASRGGDARDDERSADPASAGSACRAKARRHIRGGSGEGSRHCCPHPAQHTENSGNELHDLLQSKGLSSNGPSKRTGCSAQNEPVFCANQTREPALSRGERVARDGAFTSRRGSGEGSRHCCHHPAQNTNNSRNELHDLLQSKGLSSNGPSKRTGCSAQNEPVFCANQTREPALSRGERVARDGAFTSRRGSGEESLHCHAHPAQHTENSGNELHDLLQSKALTTNAPSKRTVSEAQNELLGGVHESDGPASPIHKPTPHPSCSGWRKRRSPTPSPHGRGVYQALGGGCLEAHTSGQKACGRISHLRIWGSVWLPNRAFSTTPALGAPPLLV